ncbi:MAG TPA: tetratricopeptide repeat protein [Gemmatimonadales bacterium]|nr:tetratricopeptide repeat protein [Gemmatimonadales bacterium]
MIHALLLAALLIQDSSSLALRRRVWDDLAALEQVRRAGTTSARLLADVRPALDTMVFATSWGGAELEQLRLAFPGSPLLARYAARLDDRVGLTDAALGEVERLVRLAPDDVELQRMRGRLLEKVNRPAEALDAYARALDLAPEDDSSFRALQQLSEGQGALPILLEQIRRLRIRLPASAILRDHEAEVSARLGARR